MIAAPIDPLELPVSASALADWLRLDDASDPVLIPALNIATQAVIDFIQRDLLPRRWTVTYSDEAIYRRDLSPPVFTAHKIELPYTQLVSVQSVTAYGQTLAATDYKVIAGSPASIMLNDPLSTYYRADEAALHIAYTAGFDVVPEALKVCILTIAAYVYQMRGACGVDDAVRQSGAAAMLLPWASRARVVF